MCKRKREFLGLLMLIGALVGQVLSSFGAFKTIHPHDHERDCTLFRGPVGAEDLQIHNGVAFISSDNRRQWMKSGLLFSHPHERMEGLSPSQQGAIYVFNLKRPQATPRRLPIVFNTIASTHDIHFHPHGLSLIETGGQLFLYVICHTPGPDEVRVFRVLYQGESPIELEWVRTLRHPLSAQNTNDIHVVNTGGVVTVFLTILGGAKQGSLGGVVEMLTQRAWSSVLKCTVQEANFTCEVFIPGLALANGINTSPDGSLLYVAVTLSNKLNVYSREGQLLAAIETDSGLDNIDVDPSTGDLYIGAHPNLLAFTQHKDDPSVASPSQVLRVRPCNASDPQHLFHNGIYGQCQVFKTAQPQSELNFVVDEVYLSDGHVTPNSLSGSAVGAFDPLTRSLVVGGVFDDGVVVCRNR